MTDQQHHTEVTLSSDLLDDGPCLENMSAPTFAVLDAYMSGYGWLDSPTKKDCCGVAAALEAVADQVVPFAEITPQEDLESRREAMAWGMQHQAQLTRQQLLAIAAELRGDTTTTETP